MKEELSISATAVASLHFVVNKSILKKERSSSVANRKIREK